EALYNTAGGLLVAIPCIMANNHFRSRVERLIHWTEGCAGGCPAGPRLEQGGIGSCEFDELLPTYPSMLT
ncbi:MAG: MotA/TolQ/ExbB proton channel family protein, partial [Negativicutes bacterium]